MIPTPLHKSLHLLIHGRVQGVFFRDSMRREAKRLGISGWVRNLEDGTVESVVQGSPAAVEAILQWAHHGPVHAHVERISIDTFNGNYTDFEVLP